MSKIYRYMSILGRMGGTYMVLRTFLIIIHKNGKVQEHDLYLNQILHHFDYIILIKKITRMNNKKFTKMGP